MRTEFDIGKWLEYMRVSDTTFSKKMRNEFPPAYKAKVIEAINQVIHESRKY